MDKNIYIDTSIEQSEEVISQYMLDCLEEEVCTNISVAKLTKWLKVVPYCVNINKEVLSVYTNTCNMVKQFTRQNTSAQDIQAYRESLVTRLYILLYYLHRDDEEYKVIVFPYLTSKMKLNTPGIIRENINKPIDKIIENHKKLQELRAAKSVLSNDSTSRDKKQIVLTNQSEMVRVVKAMYMAGYFKFSDGSVVSEAEVGRKLCADFGIKSTWDSLVQAAYKVDDVSKSFDTLRDKALGHYKKVNKIQESNAQNTIR